VINARKREIPWRIIRGRPMHSCENKSVLKKRENEIRVSMEAPKWDGLKAAPKP